MTEKVTPFTGVWVEISDLFGTSDLGFRSHLSRVCGLKYYVYDPPNSLGRVTPFTGVWVEIRYKYILPSLSTGHTFHGCVG